MNDQLLTNVLMHSTCGLQPPLLFTHSFMSLQSCLRILASSTPIPSIEEPMYPGGQASQVYPGQILQHCTPGQQGFASSHSSMSRHVEPLPVQPFGQGPHLKFTPMKTKEFGIRKEVSLRIQEMNDRGWTSEYIGFYVATCNTVGKGPNRIVLLESKDQHCKHLCAARNVFHHRCNRQDNSHTQKI